eukprot:scaffold77063_cov20-Tisochrysis_lutea.AAC.4
MPLTLGCILSMGMAPKHDVQLPLGPPAGRPITGKARSVAIYDPVGDASEAQRAAEAKREEAEANQEEDPSKEGSTHKEEGKEKAEGSKGTVELKYTTSARRKSFARQKSRSGGRPTSVGYHARGRTRVVHSLDARALLEEGKGPPELPPPKPFLSLMCTVYRNVVLVHKHRQMMVGCALISRNALAHPQALSDGRCVHEQMHKPQRPTVVLHAWTALRLAHLSCLLKAVDDSWASSPQNCSLASFV